MKVLSSSNRYLQAGMTLLEAMLSLAIGVFLLGGVLATYVAMKSTTQDTTTMGELQEAGRLALNILAKDIAQAGFSGKFSPSSLAQATVDGSITLPAADCVLANTNNGSFPSAALSGQSFFYLWATELTSTSALGCISGAKKGTDLIQIKRVIADPVTEPVTLAALADNQFYLASNSTAAVFVAGSTGVLPTLNNQEVWPYVHRIYYIGSFDGVPGIRRRELVGNSGVASMGINSYVVPGIEMMHFMFGVDTDLDGAVNTYIPASSMTSIHWENVANKVLTVRIYVLARSIDQDADYTNNNTYTLGNRVMSGGGDHYRRMVFSTTVKVQNAAF